MLDIVASYHGMQFQGKLKNQTWENGKTPSFEHNFGPFGPNLGHQSFFFQKYGFASQQISWSAIIMYNTASEKN